MNKYMKEAINEALEGMRRGEGGPFGAVIVKDGKIIAKAHNSVLSKNDPTAHAEIEAIRKASKKLGRFSLDDCEIYSTCEPCPMCFSAIHWAKIPKLYFGATRNDAKKAGFDDEYLYEVLKGEREDEKMKVEHIDEKACQTVFEEWEKKEDKKMY